MVLVSFFLKGAKSVAGARLRLPGEPRVFPRRQAAGVPSSVTECPECVWGSPSLPSGPVSPPQVACLPSLCPAPNTETEPLLTWKKAQDAVPWNIMLLLGGGFAMAKGCEVRAAGGLQTPGGVGRSQSRLQAQHQSKRVRGPRRRHLVLFCALG